MDTDSNKITWVVVIIAAVAIMGGLFVKFVPDITSQIQSYVQTVTDNSSGTVVDSDDNSDFTYSDPDTDNDTILVTGYTGNKEDVTIPTYRKIGSVEYKVTAIGSGAFKGNKNLKQVTIPDSVTTIDPYAFNGDSSLTQVTLGAGVTEIDNYAFQNTGLTSIDLPDSLKSIDDYAFQNTALTSVDFPASLTSIGNYAFENASLSSISFKSSVDLSPSAFRNNNLTNVTLPKGSSYVTASAYPGHATFDPTVTVTVK